MYTIDANVIAQLDKLRRIEEEGMGLLRPTLHELTRTAGIDHVAHSIDRTPRTLEQHRSGRYGQGVDLWAQLAYSFKIDVCRSIVTIARVRANKDTSSISPEWLDGNPGFLEDDSWL